MRGELRVELETENVGAVAGVEDRGAGFPGGAGEVGFEVVAAEAAGPERVVEREERELVDCSGG